MHYGYVYKTTNLINNKIYIGQHKWVGESIDSNYLGSGYLLKRALQVHGRKNFKCELLDWAETKEALDKLEVYWIDKLDARNPEIGYNIALGGVDGTLKGRHHTDVSKKKMSNSMQDRCYVNKGDTILLIKHSELADYVTSGWNTGLGNIWIHKVDKNKRVTPPDVDAYLDAGWELGRITTRTDQIFCIETNQIWSSWKALAEDLALTTPGALSQYIDKRPYNGLHYCHKRLYDKMSLQEREAFLNTSRTESKKAVFCVELNQYFDSIAAAAKELNLASAKISLVCNGSRKTHGGYHFKFIKE